MLLENRFIIYVKYLPKAQKTAFVGAGVAGIKPEMDSANADADASATATAAQLINSHTNCCRQEKGRKQA